MRWIRFKIKLWMKPKIETWINNYLIKNMGCFKNNGVYVLRMSEEFNDWCFTKGWELFKKEKGGNVR